MGLAEIRSFEWPLIKREARRILENPPVLGAHPLALYHTCYAQSNLFTVIFSDVGEESQNEKIDPMKKL
jgi:hypothetical protein